MGYKSQKAPVQSALYYPLSDDVIKAAFTYEKIKSGSCFIFLDAVYTERTCVQLLLICAKPVPIFAFFVNQKED